VRGACRRVEYATRVQPGLALAELDGNQFLANLDACAEVYAAAMHPPEEQLPGRHMIMERHAGYAGFRAVAAIMLTADGGPAPDGTAPAGKVPGAPAHGRVPAFRAAPSRAAPGRAAPSPAAPSPAAPSRAAPSPAAPGRAAAGGPGTAPPPLLVGFAYGFHGGGGQWWHDLVSRVAAGTLGARAADAWFGDSLEIAEVHVLPGHQGRGTGLAMMLRLTSERAERAAVLSTMDADTKARRLYRGLGFTDLLTGFTFPGTEMPYAIMGAPLPLPGAVPASARPGSPSRS
jgi:GNAT superfamily N-acetyltransferase